MKIKYRCTSHLLCLADVLHRRRLYFLRTSQKWILQAKQSSTNCRALRIWNTNPSCWVENMNRFELMAKTVCIFYSLQLPIQHVNSSSNVHTVIILPHQQMRFITFQLDEEPITEVITCKSTCKSSPPPTAWAQNHT